MTKLTIHLFGAFQIKIEDRPIDNFRSNKVRALLAYLIAEGKQPIPRSYVENLLWHGYQPDTARGNLRGALTNLRHVLEEAEIIDIGRHLLTFKPQPPVNLWCDLFLLEEMLQNPEAISVQQWQMLAPFLQRDFLESLDNVDSKPFQQWRSNRQRYYRQQMERLSQKMAQATIDASPLPSATLPRPLTLLVGRKSEIAEVAQRVLDPNYPLVTLMGEGGIGKTRLALAVAHQVYSHFADGAYFVPLAALGMGGQVREQLAIAIGEQCKLAFQGKMPPHQQLFRYLQSKQLLLILDSFEHLVDGADFIVDLLQAAPRLSVLVTSRQRLNFQAEWVIRLSGLPIPDAVEAIEQSVDKLPELLQSASVQLFVERAARATPGFRLTAENVQSVVKICRLVEGLPLAIELAAARTEVQSCQELADALQDNYHLLASSLRDLPVRQRTMQSVLLTSWQLLTPEQRRILLGCSVFHGGFSAEAVTQIVNTTVQELSSLETCSLLRQETRGDSAEARYSMHELVRQFCREQLSLQPDAQALTDGLHLRHAQYYGAFLTQWRPNLEDLRPFLDVIWSELDNVRASWNWACEQKNLALLHQFYEGLCRFFQLSGLLYEGVATIEKGIAAARAVALHEGPLQSEAELLLAQLLLQLVVSYTDLSQIAEVEQSAQAALELAIRLHNVTIEMSVYRYLSHVAWMQGRYTHQKELLEKALYLAELYENVPEQVLCLSALGLQGSAVQDYPAALHALHRALALTQQYNFPMQRSSILNNLGVAYRDSGDFGQAIHFFNENLQLNREVSKKREVALTFANLGALSVLLGQYEQAIAYMREAQQIFVEEGEKRLQAELLTLFAILYEQSGDVQNALAYCQQTIELAGSQHFYHPHREAWLVLGNLNLHLGKLDLASAAYQQVDQLSQGAGVNEENIQCKACFAELLLAQGKQKDALSYVDEILQRYDSASFNPFQRPQGILLTCYHVLAANHDSRALSVLQQADIVLQNQADKISDESLRRSFLTRVPVNQEIVESIKGAG